MTGVEEATRRADIRTRVDRPTAVASALRPDNTAEMETRVEDSWVITTIERETTGGLQSTVEDYVVNLGVATRLLARYGDEERKQTKTDDEPESDIDIDIDTDTDTENTHHS